jgi:hypothetical protein
MYSFFTGLTNNYAARCVTESEIYKMDREDFIKIIKENDQDFEKFCSMKDDISLKDYSYSLNYRC